MKELNRIYNEDCLSGMNEIESNSVDMILCDLPYGVTGLNWDKILPTDKLWAQYERIIKGNGAIVLFASGSFTYKLIHSKYELFRYKWIWAKNTRTNFLNAHVRPMSAYEEVLVFSKGVAANRSRRQMPYYPQGLKPLNKRRVGPSVVQGSKVTRRADYKQRFANYPADLLRFNSVVKPDHPTQKPVELFEYLIKTYTKENQVVLDNCMGSGTTAVACINTDRQFIGFETDKNYFEIANKRINELRL